MISGQSLVNKVREAYEAKWGYIYGTRGQVWTQKQQDSATRAMTVKYGQKWVGKRVADCSGLFVFAFRENGGKIYHGSDTIWNKYTVPETRIALAGEVKIRYGAAVFQNNGGKRTHMDEVDLGSFAYAPANSASYFATTATKAYFALISNSGTAETVFAQAAGEQTCCRGWYDFIHA